MQLTEHVHILDSTRGSYAYIILDSDIVLIDTGRPDQRRGILRDLESLGVDLRQIKHILLTHHDLDHMGNAAFLQQASGAMVWASALDLPFIKGERHRPGIKRLIELVLHPIPPSNLHSYPASNQVADVSVVPAPGHTPGHVCLAYEDVLFAGDLVHVVRGKAEPYPAFWNWDTRLLEESWLRVSRLAHRWLCPAHGRPIDNLPR